MQSRLTVVALLGAMALAACTSNVPPASPATPSPTATEARSPSSMPTVGATPTAALPSATPRPTDVGPLTLQIPEAAVHKLSRGAPSATFGSRVFRSSSPSRKTGASIFMGDFATGTSLMLVTLAKGHDIDGMAATADRVIWVETWRDHPSPPSNLTPGCTDAGKPLRWKISAMVLASRARTVLAAGTNTRTAVTGECADVNPPVVAADGERVAYTLEAPTPGKPAANRIVVRSLVDGTVIRRIQSQGLVHDLQLDGRAIAYRDLPAQHPHDAIVDPFDGALMATTDDSAPPAQIDEHVGVSGLGGGQLAWAGSGATDGSISTTTLGSDIVSRSVGFVEPDFVTEQAGQVAVGDGVIAWIFYGDTGDTTTSRLAISLSEQLAVRFIPGFFAPDFVAIRGGWLVWDSYLGTPTNWPAGLYGIPITDLPAQ